jgi:hypothetical protein
MLFYFPLPTLTFANLRRTQLKIPLHMISDNIKATIRKTDMEKTLDYVNEYQKIIQILERCALLKFAAAQLVLSLSRGLISSNNGDFTCLDIVYSTHNWDTRVD